MIANETAASEAVHCKGRTVLRRSLHSSVLSESTLGAVRILSCGAATGDCTVVYSLLAFVRQAAQRRIVLGQCVITAWYTSSARYSGPQRHMPVIAQCPCTCRQCFATGGAPLWSIRSRRAQSAHTASLPAAAPVHTDVCAREPSRAFLATATRAHTARAAMPIPPFRYYV